MALRLNNFLENHSRVQPDTLFCVADNRELTYAQAQRRVNQICQLLGQSSLGPGDRIALLQRNSCDLILTFHAVFELGLVAVPLNYRLAPHDWREMAGKTRCRAIICDREFVSYWDEKLSSLPELKECFVSHDPTSPRWIDFTKGVDAQSDDELDKGRAAAQDALALWSSGTSGRPKTVLWSHPPLVANVEQLQAVSPLDCGDRFLFVLPLCHAAGIMTLFHAIAGGASLIVPRRFEPEHYLDCLRTQRVTVSMLVPAMIRKCLAVATGKGPFEFPHLRLLVYGGESLDEKTLRQAVELFGCDLAQRYGTTETMSLSWLSANDIRRGLTGDGAVLTSAGRPLPRTELAILDAQGSHLAPNQMGEIAARGPQVAGRSWTVRLQPTNHRPPQNGKRRVTSGIWPRIAIFIFAHESTT